MSDRTLATNSPADETLLEEIRKRFDYATDEWAAIRDEAKIDMRYVAGDPWEPKDRKAREAAGRPCLSLDEIGQFTNQLINDVRQNKRAIQVTPMGNGATDQSAQLRADLIRQIEYRSNAQQAYTTMFENAVQRSYGFLRVKPRYVSEQGFDQELLIEPIVNPDMVTIDPDAQKPDGSDMRYAFIAESRSHAEFKREFPKAKVHDFGGEAQKTAPRFIRDGRVVIAEYWTKEVTERELLLLNTSEGPKVFWADELEQKPSKAFILKRRTVDITAIKQYLTNGLEILSRSDWPGRHIPLVCCFGKVLYLDEGAGSKRKLLSLVRLARDPQMLYAYIRTCEAEAIGGVPRNSWIGYKGQFAGNETDWQKANHEPVAYLEANAVTDATGGTVLPLPARQPWDPPLQNLEIAGESARRSIQAAMGTSPLPTQAQRRNEKSGVALKQIEETTQKGSYHFVDHLDEAITRTGAILDDLLPHYYDTARTVATRTAKDETKLVTINDPNQPDPDTQEVPTISKDGDHDVTLSTGPSYDSERERSSDFADQLVQNIQMVAAVAGPKPAAAILSMAIQLKNLGELGKEMADLIMPPELKEGQQQIPPEVQQAVAQLQAENAQLKQLADKNATDLQKTQMDAAADLQKADLQSRVDLQKAQMEIASRERIAAAANDVKLTDIEARIDMAVAQAMVKFQTDQMNGAQARAHETEMAATAHQHALEQGEQGAMHASQQMEQQAALAPKPNGAGA